MVQSSVFDWDKSEFVTKVYGTERTDHPGARLWTSDQRTKLVGGEIQLASAMKDERPFAGRVMSPAQTRDLIEQKGWEQTIAFQTRNPLHRAHEYALVYGAEVILRETGKKTGVVLNPLVGQLKGDDVPAATRMETYEALVEGRFLGQGDMDEELWKSKGQDLNDQLELIGLDMRMYYGGPREAVMHAIYRQNLGFTHFIIGRKHADAPFDDKSAIWGDFDAQEIFENLGGELNIKTVNVGFAAYFEEIGRVGLISDNKDKTIVGISGTKMREILNSGRDARRARHAPVDRQGPGRVLQDPAGLRSPWDSSTPSRSPSRRSSRPWDCSTPSRRRSRSGSPRSPRPAGRAAAAPRPAGDEQLHHRHPRLAAATTRSWRPSRRSSRS